MIKPNEDQVRALLNLSRDPSWDVFVDWLKDSMFTQSVANNKSAGEITIRNQGRNLELEDLLKHIKSAPDYLKNFREAKS